MQEITELCEEWQPQPAWRTKQPPSLHACQPPVITQCAPAFQGLLPSLDRPIHCHTVLPHARLAPLLLDAPGCLVHLCRKRSILKLQKLVLAADAVCAASIQAADAAVVCSMERLHVQVQGTPGKVLNMASNNFLALSMDADIQVHPELRLTAHGVPAKLLDSWP